MISVFKSNQPLTAMLFPLIIVGFALTFYFSNQTTDSMDFGLWGVVGTLDKTIVILISCVILTFNAYALNSVFNKNDFLEKNTYVIGLIYLIGCFTMSIFENPGLILFHFFDILSFRQLFFIKQNEDARKPIFNGSLLLALGLTFFPHAFPVVLFPFFTLIVIRPFVWREYMLSVLGLMTPLTYVYFYYFMYNEPNQLVNFFWNNDFVLNWSIQSFTVFATWIVLLLISFVVINSKIKRSGLRFKRLIMLSWISVLLLVLSEFVHFFNQKEYLTISQVGTTILIGTGISLTRFSIIFNLALYFLILFGIYIQLGLKLF